MKKFLVTILSLIICFMVLAAPSCQPKPIVCPTDSLLFIPTTVIIGDSLMTVHFEVCKTVVQNLNALVGQRLNSHAVGGAKISGGPIINIVNQYTAAKLANPDLDMVIIDGGGNDILYECPVSSLPLCSSTVGILTSELDALMALIKQTTPVEIIYIGLYRPLGNYAKYGDAIISFSNSIVTTLVPKYNIKFIDLAPIFINHPEYIDTDNLHPSILGAEIIANEIYKIMAHN